MVNSWAQERTLCAHIDVVAEAVDSGVHIVAIACNESAQRARALLRPHPLGRWSVWCSEEFIVIAIDLSQRLTLP